MNAIPDGMNAIADGINPIRDRIKAIQHGMNPIWDGINPIRDRIKAIGDRMNAIRDRVKALQRRACLPFGTVIPAAVVLPAPNERIPVSRCPSPRPTGRRIHTGLPVHTIVHIITMPMTYEWDPAKERANYAKHGVHFADAVGALEDERALTEPDDSTAEERFRTLGADFLARIVVVTYTSEGRTYG